MAKTISDKIHGIGTDIFQDLDILEKDTQGWSSTGESFNEAIKKLKPKTIIEVGTWKGASAINMAKLTLAEGVRDVELEVICVDTFLGSYEHYCTMGTFDLLETRKNGRPKIYDQFLSNIVHEKLQDVITPFPVDSGNGALALKHWGVQADLIYIDAAHDYEYVKIDLFRYSEVLREGGYMIIDDWHHNPIKVAAKEVFGDKVVDFHGKAAWIK
jgi:predicted O-methyltransferase YrrM